jgi:hypothetical protein
VPSIVVGLPGVTVPSNSALSPFAQVTSPLSWRGPSSPSPPSIRSLALTVPWTFEMFTNSPDCFTSIDGPATAAWAGAVSGSGGPLAAGGASPMHSLGAARS